MLRRISLHDSYYDHSRGANGKPLSMSDILFRSFRSSVFFNEKNHVISSSVIISRERIDRDEREREREIEARGYVRLIPRDKHFPSEFPLVSRTRISSSPLRRHL